MDDVVVLGISSARHSCKVCGKGFPCGRSLGGHMRSHSLAEVAMAADDYEEDESSTRGAFNNGVVDPGGGGYGLRENPKKTRRLSGLDESCHGDGGGDRAELFFSDDGEHEKVLLADVEEAPHEDDDEAERMLIPTEASAVLMPAPRRRRRSMRVPAPAPPPAAAFDTEPEDVALCLIMLSRDTPSRWAPSSPQAATMDGKKKKKKKKRRDGAAAATNSYYHHHDNDSDDTASAFFPYDEDDVEVTAKTNKKKRKPPCLAAGGYDETVRRGGRYECPGCGRAFQSYQALGGHRASHKRINSNCSVTKVVVALDHQPEPSVETNASFSTASAPASPEVDRAAVHAKKMMGSNKFECPICFKVFASGQALGGHKRSHSIASELYYERAQHAGVVEPEHHALVAARFLDLNLPAPGAED
ncbi:hypothetical protein PR202_gb25924 [Eleusine coracana subsp. coracana]|uniref:C2H2-type domain-containing protein n=1 Tax=Eleusine coracana subsp. coracana TaxID=191504 RepID=A0AAV5FQ89_ELECO|nr:hypothetical protein QOZ80_3BG0274880 [Eleusine coracana subsp. coracana]GJN37008.1 hypothetical protein PR202_gb25924 [Eleusine coracana subsp. coracana]